MLEAKFVIFKSIHFDFSIFYIFWDIKVTLSILTVTLYFPLYSVVVTKNTNSTTYYKATNEIILRLCKRLCTTDADIGM